MTVQISNHRVIRSFVRREGRMTIAQKNAIKKFWPYFGLESDGEPIVMKNVFGREAETILEIGFGDGEALISVAKLWPEKNFIGVDVHRPGIGTLLANIEKHGCQNVRVFCADVVPLLQQRIPAASLSAVHLFFPDPWPKRRHHKRRLVQSDFVTLIHQKLTHDGIFLLATDWADYADQMQSVLSAAEGFVNFAGQGNFSMRPPERPPTKFERRGQQLGHQVWDLCFKKVALPPE